MIKAVIEIDSDNDFDVDGPGGFCPAYGKEYKHVIYEATHELLIPKLVLALMSISITPPYDDGEYDEYLYLNHQANSHVSFMRHALYECAHAFMTQNRVAYSVGGNHELHAMIWVEEPQTKKKTA